MADESTPKPTDSRQSGFNPEVEASHAEAAAAATTAAQGSDASSPPAPVYVARCTGCGAQYENTPDTCPACGMDHTIEATK